MLHDLFAAPFDENAPITPIVGRSPTDLRIAHQGFFAIHAVGLVWLHNDHCWFLQKKQEPQEMVNGTTTRSPSILTYENYQILLET